MATHDYIISNASGASVRADLNNALAAIVSNNSNATSPATTYAYQWWADTTTGQLKLRNSANNAWITIFELDGTMLMEDGTVSSPGLAFASDTNTGFFRSAADKINFATGGAERLEIGSSEVVFNDPSNDVDFRVESNGQTHMLFVDAGNDRVGIGTSSPNETLVVSGNTSVAGVLQITADTSVPSAAAFLFRPTSNELALGTNSAERIRVDSSGNVGIGTTAPTAKLVVSGNASVTGALQITSNTSAPSAGAFLFRPASNELALGTNSAERARIDSSGRLGVGLTPSSTASITNVDAGLIQTDGNIDIRYAGSNTDPAGTRYLSLINTDSTLVAGQPMGGIRWVGNDTSNTSRDTASILAFCQNNTGTSSNITFNNNGGTERMRIDSDGNVGIGTTSPSTLIHGEASTAELRLKSTGASNSALVSFIPGTQTNPFYVYVNPTRNLIFQDNSTERMRIDSSGRLLVGATSALLSDAEKKLQMTHANAGAGIVLGRNDTSVSAGNLLGGIEFVGNDSNGTYQKCAKIEAIADGTHGNDDKPTRLDFSVTADNASSPTVRMRINQNGVFNHFTGDHFSIRTARTGTGPGILSVRNGATSITDGTQVFTVRADGDCENTNNSYGALSDIKLKENIVDSGSQWDDIKDIRVRKYNFKASTNYETYTQLGVIAQEVETVSPGLVSETPDFDEEGNDLGTTTKSVNYSVLYMKAVKALQEAMDRIETLETKVAALEAG
mgnify:FL=1